jgi:hypothetical protein
MNFQERYDGMLDTTFTLNIKNIPKISYSAATAFHFKNYGNEVSGLPLKHYKIAKVWESGLIFQKLFFQCKGLTSTVSQNSSNQYNIGPMSLQSDLTSQVHPGISIQQTKLGHILIIYP